MIEILNKKRSENNICEYLTNNRHSLSSLQSNNFCIKAYSRKIFTNANQFWAIDLKTNQFIGFLACYLNDKINHTAYITLISVTDEYQGLGVGKNLLLNVLEVAQKNKFSKIKLEVNKLNLHAISFYIRNNFVKAEETANSMFMEKEI